MAGASAAVDKVAEEDIDVDDVVEADQTMTLAEQQDAADSRPAKKASGPTRAPINNLEEEGRSLENLRIEVEGKGGVFEPGWSVEVLVRQTGNSIGTKDTYYFSPTGKRYRSRQEVVRVMGLTAVTQSSSPEQAYNTAQKALSEADLPCDLACGATLTSWGCIDQRPNFSSPTQLHPVGFCATWPDRDSAAIFVSRITSSDDAPIYTVSLQQNPDAAEKLVAEGASPDEVWTKAAERQRECLVTARARERALVPSDLRKPLQTPTKNVSVLDPASPPAARSAKAGQVAKAAHSIATGNGTHQLPVQSSKAVGTSPKNVAQKADAIVKSESPALKETGATVHSSQPSQEDSPTTTPSAGADEPKAPKLKLVVKQSTPEMKTAPAKKSPSQSDALRVHAATNGIPPELSKVEKRLIKAENLAGVWGSERFGLADTTVLLAMEGLPGVDELPNYEFVERRSGGWQAEIDRLEKEHLRYVRLAEKGSKALVKGKGQFVKQQEKRKRAEAKDQSPRQPTPRPSKTGTLQGWLTNGSTTSGVKSPSKAGRVLSPALLPASPVATKPGSAAETQIPKRRKTTKAPAVGREVQGVVSRLLKAVELRVDKAADRDAKRVVREAERKAKAAEKEALQRKGTEKQAGKALLPAAKKTFVQQSLSAVAHLAPPPMYPLEDSKLPGAKTPAPPPQPLPPRVLLAPSAFSAALSVLELLARYQADLGVDKLPSLEAAESVLAEPDTHSDAALSLHYPLVANVINEMWEAACTVEENADRSDFKSKDVELAFPPLTPESWPEAARRFFHLQEVAAMVKALDSSGGLGPAIGNPGNSASHPLALMDSAAVLQTILAGCPSSPDCHVAALPHTAVPSAPAGLLAMQDARALSSCEHLLRTVGANADDDSAELRGGNALMVAGRRILWRLVHEAHGKAMCGDAMKAAAAARFSAPLDLRIIAARLDEGVYGSGEEGLRRMAADVRYACALWRVGCARPKPCGFSRTQGEKRSMNVHSQVYEALGPALEEGLRLLAESSLTAKSSDPDGTQEASANGSDPSVAAAASAAPEAKDSIVNDLDRLFVPWSGCGVCWNNEDHRHLLICDETGGEYHTYCTSPPLDDVPNGSWSSPRYLERSDRPGGHRGGLHWRTSGFEDNIQLCHLLSNVEYGSLTDQQRAAVLNNLAAGLLDTSMMRQVVDGDLDKRKALSEELRTLQRRLRQEEEEQRKKAKEEREAKAARELAAQQASIAQAVAAVKGPKAAPTKAAAAAAAAAAKAGSESSTPTPKLAKDVPAEDPSRRQLPPRGTRTTTAGGLDRPNESTVSNQDLDAVKALEYDIEELIERGVLLGADRHWNRYWLLSAPRLRARQVSDRVAIVCVEIQEAQGAKNEAIQLLSPKKVKSVGADFPMHHATWGCYATPASLDALLQWLNPKGIREKELRRKLQNVRRNMVEPLSPTPSPAAPAVPAVSPAAATDRALQLTEPNTPAAAAALSGADTADGPPTAAPARPPGEGSSISPTAREEEGQHGSFTDRGLQVLREALLAARQALPDAAVDYAFRCTAERQRRWHRLVTHASDPQALMAAVVVLEGFIRREYLKPWWRLWAFPTPSPEDTGTLAAVWMRLQALQSAVKSKLGLRESAAIASPITARISARSVASAQSAAAAAASAGEDSGDEKEDDRGRGRSSAGARKPKGAVLDRDEAMALRLHEEMNGLGDSEGGRGRHALRTRARPATKRTRELRAASRHTTASEPRTGGYRSKLRRTATEDRPNYNYVHSVQEDSDSDQQAQDQAAHTAAYPAATSSGSGGGASGSADSEVQLSELENEEIDEQGEEAGDDDAPGSSSDDDATSEQDSDEPPEPVGRRTGRNTAAASRETKRARTTGRMTRSTNQ